MRHDVRKTVLTMLGMAWSIATVVLLLAYGEGFGHAIQAIWDSYGATAVGIYPGVLPNRREETRRVSRFGLPRTM